MILHTHDHYLEAQNFVRDLLVDEMSDELDHGCTNGLVVTFIAPSELHHYPLHNGLAIFGKLGVDDRNEGCVNLDSFEKSISGSRNVWETEQGANTMATRSRQDNNEDHLTAWNNTGGSPVKRQARRAVPSSQTEQTDRAHERGCG
jgi:hypothetical protein